MICNSVQTCVEECVCVTDTSFQINYMNIRPKFRAAGVGVPAQCLSQPRGPWAEKGLWPVIWGISRRYERCTDVSICLCSCIFSTNKMIFLCICIQIISVEEK